MHISWRPFVAFIVLFSAISAAHVRAQTPMPEQSASATAQTTAKVVAIDRQNRTLTLQDAKGNVTQVTAPPEVKRFDEIKVGDTINITYQESVALKIVKPGSNAPQTESSPTVTRGTGAKPSGTISQTQTANVTIQSIDMKTPSVTVKTADGRIITFLVQDRNNLNGLKPGDVVQVTYSQALMMSVK